MPALLEDPLTTLPAPATAKSAATLLLPRHATLKDKTRVTLYPIAHGPASVPTTLVEYLHREFSHEILRGSTYPMETPMDLTTYRDYWFGTFAVVALVDDEEITPGEGGLVEGRDWEKVCLGTFYIKPNYPGRCSHVCNAGFFTTPAARGRGVGNVMGETYLEFAPKLGYKYSVFNLVFANNTASIRIWEKLGFQVIGRVPRAARLANSEELVDALIIGRDLV
ncbi:GNAT family N-acetyltransferase [Aspergillus saccharolyticus JOP 1030-1]|uniref:Putative acetyltransferase, GNAT family n=1 Tax=Aspergillus saccharolyticus JOP 1030-1 TaxID=1450539 RepID=A0A318ZQ39_9EURO|nr:putative acetyltransferase, GNAT family [Aspergillus saccharolyticus JOP 1030-1]PYH46533.1 putative acetyltransferase, GNAT family [Aspergillus saccharolyticus JOP 1030-1]